MYKIIDKLQDEMAGDHSFNCQNCGHSKPAYTCRVSLDDINIVLMFCDQKCMQEYIEKLKGGMK